MLRWRCLCGVCSKKAKGKWRAKAAAQAEMVCFPSLISIAVFESSLCPISANLFSEYWQHIFCFENQERMRANDGFLFSIRIRPYIVESTCTRPITEVKPRLASPVLRWETTREQLVLYPFLPFAFCLFACSLSFICLLWWYRAGRGGSVWREAPPLPLLYLSHLLLSVFSFLLNLTFATPCLSQFKRWRI